MEVGPAKQRRMSDKEKRSNDSVKPKNEEERQPFHRGKLKRQKATSSGQSISSLKSKTVLFNVGGTKYEVSCSLLDQYPNTMLGRMASETWNNDNDDEEENSLKPLFIEQNGCRFQFVLDYMRNGRVFLPPIGTNVSKDAIMTDLVYYGFENVPSVAVQLQGGMVLESIEHIQQLETKAEAEIKQAGKEIDQLDEAHRRQSASLTERYAQEIASRKERFLQEMTELRQRRKMEMLELQVTQQREKRNKTQLSKCKELALALFQSYKRDGELCWIISTDICCDGVPDFEEIIQKLVHDIVCSRENTHAAVQSSEALLASNLREFGLELLEFNEALIRLGKL